MEKEKNHCYYLRKEFHYMKNFYNHIDFLLFYPMTPIQSSTFSQVFSHSHVTLLLFKTSSFTKKLYSL